MLNKRIQNGSTSSPSRVKSRGGFSLAEVLMALGILAMGMVFIAGVFPAGIYFTAISTERTMATVIADEAFAKIRLYGVDLNSPVSGGLPAQGCADFVLVSRFKFKDALPLPPLAMGEFLYPSDPNISEINKQYCWSALCRKASGSMPGETLVQVTVFVNRLTWAGATYPNGGGSHQQWPAPVKVGITTVVAPDALMINDAQKTLITSGSTIVEDTTGRIYRVLSHDSLDGKKIYLDRPWVSVIGAISVWVMPPPVNGGRYPCVGVYQKEIVF